jgi:arginyl-tRNA synthetase
MLSFEGNSAPYVQYTHARARSVLRKAEEKNVDLPSKISELSAWERLLMKTLLLLPSVLQDARESHMPHKLANYLYQLCQDYNAFYNTDPILKSEGSTRTLRLALSDLTSSVIKTGAELLTLRVPERM